VIFVILGLGLSSRPMAFKQLLKGGPADGNSGKHSLVGASMTNKAMIERLGSLVDGEDLRELHGDSLSFTFANDYHAELTVQGLSPIATDPMFAQTWRVFCLDNTSLQTCRQHLDPHVCVRTAQTFSEPSDFKEKQYFAIGKLKARLIMELLEKQELQELAVYDGDVIHFRNAKKLDPKMDFEYQMEIFQNRDHINIGQMLIRNTQETKKLFHDVLAEDGWDQDLVNKHKFYIPSDRRGPLDPFAYASKCWHGQTKKNQLVTIHAACATDLSAKKKFYRIYFPEQ